MFPCGDAQCQCEYVSETRVRADCSVTPGLTGVPVEAFGEALVKMLAEVVMTGTTYCKSKHKWEEPFGVVCGGTEVNAGDLHGDLHGDLQGLSSAALGGAWTGSLSVVILVTVFVVTVIMRVRRGLTVKEALLCTVMEEGRNRPEPDRPPRPDRPPPPKKTMLEDGDTTEDMSRHSGDTTEDMSDGENEEENTEVTTPAKYGTKVPKRSPSVSTPLGRSGVQSPSNPIQFVNRGE